MGGGGREGKGENAVKYEEGNNNKYNAHKNLNSAHKLRATKKLPQCGGLGKWATSNEQTEQI